MRGFPLIEKNAGRWSRWLSRQRLRQLLAALVVGILAGLLSAHVRLHLGLPGHKALLWMTPVVACRLVYGFGGCAAAGTLAAGATTLAAGGSFAGSTLYLPLVAAAGAVLDAAVAFARRRRLAWLWTIPLTALAGLVANALCFVHRLGSPWREHLTLWGISGLWATGLSYAIFGLLAGLIGAAVAGFILWRRKPGHLA